MRIWYDSVCKPYISVIYGASGLHLGGFVSDKSQELKDKMYTDDSILYMIPPRYTGLLQPSDGGINKSLKDCLKNLRQHGAQQACCASYW